MWLWHKIAAFFQTWYGSTAGTIGILLAIYNGVPTMFRSWDFLVDRFWDKPVLEILHEVRIPKNLPPFSPIGPGETHPTIKAIAKDGSYSVGDLADILNRSHRSIGKSVHRLRMQGKIELHKGGFRLKK